MITKFSSEYVEPRADDEIFVEKSGFNTYLNDIGKAGDINPNKIWTRLNEITGVRLYHTGTVAEIYPGRLACVRSLSPARKFGEVSLSVNGLIDGLVSREYDEDINMSYAKLNSPCQDRFVSTNIGPRRQALIAYLGMQVLPDRANEIAAVAEDNRLPLNNYIARMEQASH